MRKIALLCLAAVLLVSCVGIDSTLTLKDNGAGTLSMTYRVSQLVTEIGVSSSGVRAVPLPVSRDEFQRAVAKTGGRVRLTGFTRSENERDVTIHAELAFDSLESLSSMDAFKDARLKLSKDATGTTFSQTVSRSAGTPISDDTLAMIDALFGGYDLTFVVVPPRPVQATSLGTVSTDKKSATYTTSVKDAVSAKSDTIFSVSW
jgi:hypothetical protein